MTIKKRELWDEKTSKSGSREWTVGQGTGELDEEVFHCGRKIRFETHSQAEDQAAQYSKVKGERFVTYRCRYCKSVHIGGDR